VVILRGALAVALAGQVAFISCVKPMTAVASSVCGAPRHDARHRSVAGSRRIVIALRPLTVRAKSGLDASQAALVPAQVGLPTGRAGELGNRLVVVRRPARVDPPCRRLRVDSVARAAGDGSGHC
jgi:hypothetical protein